MGRRRRVLLEEEDSDASQSDLDDDFDDDFDDIDNPHQRKRRKTKESRSDWTKAPSFVTGDKQSKVQLETVADDLDSEKDSSDDGSYDLDEGEEDGDIEGFDEEPGSDAPSPPPAVSSYEKDDEEDDLEKPSFSGLGASKGGIGSSKGGIGSRGGLGSSFSKAGLGSANTSAASAFSKGANLSLTDETAAEGSSSFQPSRGGIGSSSRSETPAAGEEFPSSFASHRSRSFLRSDAPSPSPKPVLSSAEKTHFANISGSFGARMLAKMGWESGTGLGASGDGIVAPVESKLRPQKMGIAFKGFKEKTEQSKMEARRRGEVISDDEDEKTKKARKAHKAAKDKQSDLWKRPKKVKTQVVHKSYEEYISEAGHDSSMTGIGQIIDATGAVPKEVASLADVSLDPWASTTDSTRIPEVRHNVRLITDSCKSEIDGLAREAKDLNEKKQYFSREDNRLRRKVEEEAELIARLQQVQLVTNEINSKSKELMSSYEPSLEPLSPLFYQLLEHFSREFHRYRLDEIVVAALAPLLRRLVTSWNPLEDPYAFVTTFRGWKGALRINTPEDTSNSQLDVYGSASLALPAAMEKPMTPFESLLWNVWLPRVRTSINNEWSPSDPQPAVKLYEAWSTFLPPFIRDNLLDQLIIPKVHKAVAEWTPKRQVSLQSIVFPWLPHVGLRLEEFVGDARRKIKGLLRSWSVEEEIPMDLLSWKDVFDKGDWDTMLLKYVIPKLGATLREDFKVNPRNQDNQPLERVLNWASILSPTIMSQIIETEFFHKWLDVLYIWLIQPNVNYEEIAQWYSYWSQQVFPETVRRYAGIERGFTRGQQLINEALSLGPDAPTKLARPDYKAELSRPTSPVRNGPSQGKLKSRQSAISQEITFRSLVEEYAAAQNLLFIPAGQAHAKSRMPMFRVSKTADGRGGLLVYILDDAVWAAPTGAGSSEEDFTAISLDDMVARASA